MALSRINAGAIALATALIASTATAAEKHGFAILGSLKYGPEFEHFEYVNPNAPKGGEVVLWFQGTFDSMQPFILKGVPGAGSNPFIPGGSLLTFESLMVASADEPDSYYGLVAKSVALADDRQSISFTLRDDARFHDGSKITAEDVVFSFETLKSKQANPLFRVRFRDVIEARAVEPLKVRFVFKQGAITRDLPGYVATMPILSKAYYESREFNKTTLEAPLASGPYKVAEVDAGRAVTYERVKDHWARDLPVYRGRFNFDRIRWDYYRERDIGLQALLAGKVDFREEFMSRDWATRYDVPQVESGLIKREEPPDATPSGTQAFFLNTRRKKFQDRRVREALAYAFDFEWTNKHIFYDAYKRTTSIFENSDLAAKAAPSEAELALLAPYREKLPAAALAGPYEPPRNDGSGNLRGPLRKARKLLQAAGWRIKDGRLTNAAGETFEIEFLSFLQGFERIVLPYTRNLKRLGIEATFRRVESAQYQRRVQTYDYDVVTSRFGGTLTPGVELRNFWASSSAGVEGSRNYAGVQDGIVDDLIEKVIGAKNRAELTTATRALDRVVMAGHYLVPQWYLASHRIAYWDFFGRPKIKPKYALGFIDTWWLDPAKKAEVLSKR
ncbi:MAG: extracellular solute-binding protein [Alphaproteobacteria bacterium]|jgi:microcin C transport system substrate-binding protein|nr:extracellular solute-binding protein [Alphaproteobacteria bacterium]